jgi:hypothetical protein
MTGLSVLSVTDSDSSTATITGGAKHYDCDGLTATEWLGEQVA